MSDGSSSSARGKQQTLFDIGPDWRDLWRGMPEYVHEDLTPWQSILVHFQDKHDQGAFARLIGQTITPKTQSVWYPEAEIGHYADRRYRSNRLANPKYPIYVISKGRWESRLTSKALERIGIPYQIVIEPQEYDNYAAVINPAKILVLPFSNLGQGSIPARNWVWEHAISIGAERHWILDDNIKGFYRYNQNLKVPVTTGATFRAIEDFSDRYENVALSGMNYFMFVSRKDPQPPFTLNTRIYSCILIQNDIPYRWRGRYNEDTDLSLRVLKDRLCTVLFNAFLAEKSVTMTMAGGNTDELYADDGRLKMAQSLLKQHPDVVQITERWGRPQHYINYRRFRCNELIPKPGLNIPDEVDNFGMELEVDEATAND